MEARVELVEHWHDFFVHATETYSEGRLAEYLAYLWPAVLKGTHIEVFEGDSIVEILREFSNEEAEIWDYIDILEGF